MFEGPLTFWPNARHFLSRYIVRLFECVEKMNENATLINKFLNDYEVSSFKRLHGTGHTIGQSGHEPSRSLEMSFILTFSFVDVQLVKTSEPWIWDSSASSSSATGPSSSSDNISIFSCCCEDPGAPLDVLEKCTCFT